MEREKSKRGELTEDKYGKRTMAGGQTFRKKLGRRTNMERETWQVDKCGERTVAGGQMWR